MVKPGFSLVEVIVAIALFGMGALGAAATLGLALRKQREADAHAEAVALAGEVLDSLALVPVAGAGERTVGRHALRWATRGEAGAATVELIVTFHDGTAPRELHFTLAHAPLPPRPAGRSPVERP